MPQTIELDASPTKDIYRSIIADYSLNAGLCELVDNAIDVRSRTDKKKPVVIQIDADIAQQTISLTDNAGGVGRNDLELSLPKTAFRTARMKTQSFCSRAIAFAASCIWSISQLAQSDSCDKNQHTRLVSLTT